MGFVLRNDLFFGRAPLGRAILYKSSLRAFHYCPSRLSLGYTKRWRTFRRILSLFKVYFMKQLPVIFERNEADFGAIAEHYGEKI